MGTAFLAPARLLENTGCCPFRFKGAEVVRLLAACFAERETNVRACDCR
jgi:hypothetical protein